MSKKTGNFITLTDAIDMYTADSSRITLADSGDTIDNGNFKEINANATILKLFNLGKWIENEIEKIDPSKIDMSQSLESMDAVD